MPKYRALHVKITNSFDFNEMPDDFVRLTWVLLPLILDSEGRGIDSPMWIRAKMYPLRNGVIDTEIRRAFEWYEERGMIIRYTVNGRAYFYIPTWKEYQKGTQKEAASELPAPPKLKSSSGVVPELVSAAVYAYESESASEFVSASESDKEQEFDEFGFPIPPGEAPSGLSAEFEKITGLMAYNLEKWQTACQNMMRNKVTPEILERAIEILRDKKFNVSGPWSVERTAIGLVSGGNGEQKQSGGGVGDDGRIS